MFICDFSLTLVKKLFLKWLSQLELHNFSHYQLNITNYHYNQYS